MFANVSGIAEVQEIEIRQTRLTEAQFIKIVDDFYHCSIKNVKPDMPLN
jgi:hypothetical protein